MPSDTVFNLLKSSTHWGSEDRVIISKFFWVLFLEYSIDAFDKEFGSMSYFSKRVLKKSINCLSSRSSIRLERCSAYTNEETSPLFDMTDSTALFISL